MFTGIIEDLGSVTDVRRREDFLELVVRTGLAQDAIRTGDSVAVDGVCLTVTRKEGAQTLWFDVSHETVAHTTLRLLKRTDRVNLERALTLGGRLGGHLVTGHVDGTGEVLSRTVRGPGLDLAILAPRGLVPYLVPKGAVAGGGVSLTVNRPEGRRFLVTLVPHTLEKTTLGGRRPGDLVNLEADILGKYVRHFVTGSSHGGLDEEFLAEHGFLTPGLFGDQATGLE